MKRIFIHLSTLLFIGLLYTTTTAQQTPDKKKFYYAFNEKIFIEEVPGKFVVKFKSVEKARVIRNRLQKSLTAGISYQNETSVRIDLAADGDINRFLKNSLTDVELIKPVFKYQQQELSYTNEILVEPNDGIRITEVIKRSGFANVTKIKEGKFYHVIEVATGHDACDVANKIQESGLVKYSHPNFNAPIQKNQVIPNDTYFNNQFYLRNTGQVFNPIETHFGLANADINASFAWNTTLGVNSIIVAVLDDGVTPDHPDLPNSRQVRLNGSNFVPGENPNNPYPERDNNHGNSCAGIIAATQNNNEGITGIAPNVRIMPIKILNEACQPQADVYGIAAAIDFAWQNGAHVISNSWGFGSINPNFEPVIVAAINRAVTQGRNGRGSVVVFSASNSASHALGQNGVVRFPSNVQINGVLTVGASDRDDFQADYSPTSNAGSAENQIIDIVAPSHRAYPNSIFGETFEVWTTDVPGTTGYNSWHGVSTLRQPPMTGCEINPVGIALGEVLPAAGPNNLAYTGRFGGTSAACPQVAAVAALLLSVNSGLTQQQVFDIITQTADDVGGYAYNANGWCPELGNGRLNACAAVSRAATMFIVNGNNLLCTTATYTVEALPAGATVLGWTSSNTNIATISAAGVATKTAAGRQKGYVTFTATVGLPNRCGFTFASKTIYAGVPTISFVTGPFDPVVHSPVGVAHSGQQYYFVAHDVQPVPAGPFTWTLLPPPESENFPTLYSGNPSSLMTMPPEPGTFQYIARVQTSNACGSTTSEMNFWLQGSGLRITAAPNPVNDELIVTLKQESAQKQDPDNEKITISLYDFYNGRLVKQYSFIQGGTQYKLNVKGVKKGTYVLQVVQGKLKQTKQIMVE
jgi:subtilisin family serine protease